MKSSSITVFIFISIFIFSGLSCEKDNPSPNDNTNQDNNNQNNDDNLNDDNNEPEDCPATVLYADYSYPVVKIGEQCWFSENLKYIPEISPLTNWNSSTEARYTVYDYSGTSIAEAIAHENYSIFGVLYNHTAAKTACPSGWELPSDEDWNDFIEYLINNSHNFDNSAEDNKIAKSLAAKTQWTSSPTVGHPGNNLNDNNSTGFTALPAGVCVASGGYYYKGSFTGFWSSTEETNAAPSFVLYNNEVSLNRNMNALGTGLSVRCFKKI